MIPFTRKKLLDWAGARVFREGEALFRRDAVKEANHAPPHVNGVLVRGDRSIQSQFRILKDGSPDNLCPCRDSVDRGIICAHMVALGLELLRRQNDPDRVRKLQEEERRAAHLAAIAEGRYLKRVPADTPGARPARLVLTLVRGWRERGPGEPVTLHCSVAYEGRKHPADQVPPGLPLAFSSRDEALLYVLEDVAAGPAPARCSLGEDDFINILQVARGGALEEEGQEEPVQVQGGPVASFVRLALDPETGELILRLAVRFPDGEQPENASFFVSGRNGWVCAGVQCRPLERVLPLPFRPLYHRTVTIPRRDVPRFLQQELSFLQAAFPVETEVTPDLFAITPAPPLFRLRVRGSPASLALTLFAEYGEIRLIAAKPDLAGQFALPDPDDLMRYTVRHPEAEREALARLARHGAAGERGDRLPSVVGCREVLNFLGGVLPALRRLGWKVDLEGRIQFFMEEAAFAAPVVRITEGEDRDWFEADIDFEDQRGESLSMADIQRALLKGESFVQRGERTVLLDSEAIDSLRNVFEECASGRAGNNGRMHIDRLYAGFLMASVNALDGVDVEAAPAWQRQAEGQNRGLCMEPVPLPGTMEGILRSYQKEGVYWLRFLEKSRCGGILADEMGLGKTLQALAWIEMARAREEARQSPCLVVCPTSLVQNWAEEAGRFTPGMKILAMSGSDRHASWNDLDRTGLVITSYALLRRDIDRYLEHTFAAVILDEAQHIKNRSTQNAQAAKRVRAIHRFVLTGTPLENSVADLWSIMDFLMPGYLGSHEDFRARYELPIAQADEEGERAQRHLRRKLHPFLLRRLKKEVARDLPEKIERIASCDLTGDQQLVYRQLLEQSRRKVADLVSARGFDRSRMEILKTLLRLRQICCHLDLLRLPGLRSEAPSGKMDLFFELLDEAIDAGHRVLVFSQFTSMLAILRKELEGRDIDYCYLDGATRDRMAVVHQFNSRSDLPVFLMSLKAGGTGLNLTGADMVIHFDPWWNPAVEDQATDRAHRIGQKRTVYSVKLITRQTVEEKVLAMQRRKRSVIDATLTKEARAGKLTWEDVRDILNL